MRIAVFASGRGSNLLAIHAAILADELQEVSLDLLVCDRPDAPVVEEVKKRGIPDFIFRPQDYPDKNSFETLIADKLKTAKIELVVLAGYMRLIGTVLLEKWEGRMINLHPSLLPSFPGIDAIGQAWRAGVKETGVTVHFVDAGMDTGNIFLQRKVSVDPDDTEESLAEKIHNVEHQLLPEAIQKFQQKR
mgnify:FL=1